VEFGQALIDLEDFGIGPIPISRLEMDLGIDVVEITDDRVRTIEDKGNRSGG
jgi:hypothetical protein